VADNDAPPGTRRVPNTPEDLPPPAKLNGHREPRDTPPHDMEAQRALLGAAMLDASAASVAASLPREAWYGESHRDIAEAISELDRAGEAIDTFTVADRLGPDALIRAGGLQELTEIMASCPTTENASSYARIVRDMYKLRWLARAGEATRQAALDRDVHAAIGHLTAALDALPDEESSGDAKRLAAEYMDLLTRREAGETNTVPTGMYDLDEIIGGLHPGNFAVWGARTGQGKTATLCQLTLNLLRQGKRVLYVSLEMPWPELWDRWVGNIARINTRALRRGDVGSHWTDVSNALGELAETGLRVARPTSVTVPAIRAEARQHKSDVVIVDYLQLVHSVSRTSRSRENDVAEVSRALKGLALALEVPVCAAAQLNRNLESRVIKRPELHDLRDSGQIEQDSDVVVMVYREHAYDDTVPADELELIVRKNRHGELSTAHMTFMGPFQAVLNRAPESRLRSV
jgi:replicative DNA helicase